MKYRDIKLKFIEANCSEEITGEAEYEFNKTATKFIYSHYNEEIGKPRAICDALLKNKSKRLVVFDADSFLLLINALDYASDSNKRKFKVTCAYSHIIWLFHDLYHAEHDATDADVYVNEYAEKYAINTSISLCLENNIPVPWHIIQNTEEEYLERFGTPLRLKDFPRKKINTKNFTLNALAE